MMALKGKTMRMSGYATKVAVLLAMATLSCGVANAQLPFASFSQANTNTTPFRFINDGTANSKYGLYDAGGVANSILVNFAYQTANALGTAVGEVVTARMTMTSLVNGTASTFAGFNFQDLRNIQIDFVLEDADFALGLQGTNLLSVTSTLSLDPINGTIGEGNGNNNTNGSFGTTATMSGLNGGSTASLQATESASGQNYVGYTSAYLDFSKEFVNRNFSLAISSIQNPAFPAPNGGYRRGSAAPGNPNSSEYIRTFQATMSGDFASDPQPFVPEPASIAFFLPAIVAAGWGIRKRMR
jgi:hypothetical protein